MNPQADPKMPKSRKLLAVPFVGKDVPSRASEFSHPDVVIGEVQTVRSLTKRRNCAFVVSPMGDVWQGGVGVSVVQPLQRKIYADHDLRWLFYFSIVL